MVREIIQIPVKTFSNYWFYDKRVINQQKCNFDMMITTWDKIHTIQLKKASLNTKGGVPIIKMEI